MGEPTGTAYPAVAPVIDAGQWHSRGRVDNESDPALASWVAAAMAIIQVRACEPAKSLVSVSRAPSLKWVLGKPRWRTGTSAAIWLTYARAVDPSGR